MLLTETGILCIIAFAAATPTTSMLLASLSPIIEAQLGRRAPNAAGVTIDTNVLMIVGDITLLSASRITLARATIRLRQPPAHIEQGAVQGPAIKRELSEASSEERG